MLKTNIIGNIPPKDKCEYNPAHIEFTDSDGMIKFSELLAISPN